MVRSDSVTNFMPKPDIQAALQLQAKASQPLAPAPTLTTTPINVDLRDPRGAYRPGTRKTKNYAEEEPQAMKKGGLVKKKTTMKKKK